MGRRTRRRRGRSCSCTPCSPHRRFKKEFKIMSWLIEEPIAPLLTEEQKKYIHPCGTSDLFLGLLLPAFTLLCSYENFQVVSPNAYKAYQEFVSGAIAVAICVLYMLAKLYDFPDLSPMLLTFKSWIRLPTCPANIRIYRDTAVVVFIPYVLLLDINLSYLYLVMFPVIAIAFIYALYDELCRRRGDTKVEHGEVINSSVSSSSTGGTEANDEKIATKEPEELGLILMVPFCALLVMAQLDDAVADTFVISQFLLFLSATLGALARMMMRLPAGAAFPGVKPAAELLHKTFLLLLLVTAHAVAAEWLGEDVVLTCMPEVVPVLLWFSVHLDRDGAVTTVDKMRPYRNAAGAAVALVFAYLATSMDASGLSRCKAVLVSCGVSGFLTYYLVFMLRQWPGQQEAAGKDVAYSIAGTTEAKSSSLSRKQVGKDKGATVSLEEVVQSSRQGGSLEEAAQLLKFWANILLVAAAALLALMYRVAVRLHLQQSRQISQQLW